MDKENLIPIIVIESLVKQHPNDADLGAAVRALVKNGLTDKPTK